MRHRSGWNRFGALVLCALFSVTLAGCPDYTKKGSDGEIPKGLKEGERGAEYSVYGELPKTLVCGQTYKLTFGVKQQVAGCVGFNFKPMYDRAVANAKARFAELSCAAECGPIYTWQIARKWDCQDLFGTRQAYATVQFGILCPKETDKKPAGLAEPTAADLKAPAQEPAGYPQIQESDEVIFEEIGGTMEAPCPGSELITFTYVEKVPSCDIKNFQPYVQRAEDRAQFYYGLLACDGTCVKQPFKVLRDEWSCDRAGSDFLVEVKVSFELACKRPG